MGDVIGETAGERDGEVGGEEAADPAAKFCFKKKYPAPSTPPVVHTNPHSTSNMPRTCELRTVPALGKAWKCWADRKQAQWMIGFSGAKKARKHGPRTCECHLNEYLEASAAVAVASVGQHVVAAEEEGADSGC
jgi:hypothetical protein